MQPASQNFTDVDPDMDHHQWRIQDLPNGERAEPHGHDATGYGPPNMMGRPNCHTA